MKKITAKERSEIAPLDARVASLSTVDQHAKLSAEGRSQLASIRYDLAAIKLELNDLDADAASVV